MTWTPGTTAAPSKLSGSRAYLPWTAVPGIMKRSDPALWKQCYPGPRQPDERLTVNEDISTDGHPWQLFPATPTSTCKHPDGCARKHKTGGWCNMHYHRVRQDGSPGEAAPRFDHTHPDVCAIDGCEREHRTSGWCALHYSRARRNGDPGEADIAVYPDVCAADGCEREHASRGWCDMHYARVRLTGDPGEAAPRFDHTHPDTCTVYGCEREHYTRGWCALHYQRTWLTGDPGEAEPRADHTHPDVCTVDGCEREHRTRGWCEMHYERVKKTGLPGPPGPILYPDMCTVYGCEREHLARGWCIAHYRRVEKHGDTLAHLPIRTTTPCESVPEDCRDHFHISDADRLAIYERDGWTCWLCGDPVDTDVDWSDHEAPTLDHLIPRSHGGTHDPGNLGTAHRLCNIRRHNTIDIVTLCTPTEYRDRAKALA